MIPLHYIDGLIPVVVQDAENMQVLMVAYANEEAVRLTKQTGYAHFYSRSRKKLWKKGEESGHVQKIVEILVDCDEDCILYLVEQTGAACHIGYRTCFYRNLEGKIIGERVFDPSLVYGSKDQ
jgi:phosphoribosyl-AMP cyclohydrolase